MYRRSMYRNMSGGVPIDEDGLAEAYAKVTPEHESAAIEAKEESPGGCYYDRRIKKENGLYRRSVALWMYRLFF